jgi:hypothetical protein
MTRFDGWDDGPGNREGYDVGLACLNGHGITGSLQLCPDLACQFCPQCGEPTITKCQNSECAAELRGNLRESFGSWDPDLYCHNCGTPFPWTTRRAEALSEAIDELDTLSQPERDKLKQSIPDVLKQTPKSEIAARRYRKAIDAANPIDAKMLSEVLKKAATEAFLSLIELVK